MNNTLKSDRLSRLTQVDPLTSNVVIDLLPSPTTLTNDSGLETNSAFDSESFETSEELFSDDESNDIIEKQSNILSQTHVELVTEVVTMENENLSIDQDMNSSVSESDKDLLSCSPENGNLADCSTDKNTSATSEKKQEAKE